MTDSALTTSAPTHGTGSTTVAAREPGRGPGTVRERLDQAGDNLAAAERVLTARVPDPSEIYGAVDGAIRLANSLAELVTIVMRQAPASLHHGPSTGPVLDELLADLRAMHGCLTSGALLLAPAREDLHLLVAHPATGMAGDPVSAAPARGAPAHEVAVREAADPDVADQQRPARAEPTDDEGDHEPNLDGVAEVLEADPADVVDQRRDAPVLDETEPWP